VISVEGDRMEAWFEAATYLVELVAEVDGVDVVAFQVGEHDDLRMMQERGTLREGRCQLGFGRDRGDGCLAWIRTKKTMVKSRTAESRTDKRKSQPVVLEAVHREERGMVTESGSYDENKKQTDKVLM
jgi:hypothetical protein